MTSAVCALINRSLPSPLATASTCSPANREVLMARAVTSSSSARSSFACVSAKLIVESITSPESSPTARNDPHGEYASAVSSWSSFGWISRISVEEAVAAARSQHVATGREVDAQDVVVEQPLPQHGAGRQRQQTNASVIAARREEAPVRSERDRPHIVLVCEELPVWCTVVRQRRAGRRLVQPYYAVVRSGGDHTTIRREDGAPHAINRNRVANLHNGLLQQCELAHARIVHHFQLTIG
eukprot:3818675-Prymnesium_polylepis.1